MTIILVPEHPSGCPNETAPPKGFTLLGSSFNFLIFANPTTEKASFNSQKSISSILRFAFLVPSVWL